MVLPSGIAFSQSSLIISRSVVLSQDDHLEITYTILNDSCKGFFTIHDSIAGKVKLSNFEKNYPSKFSDNVLLVSGASLKVGDQIKFNFKTFNQNIDLMGHINYENYPFLSFTQQLATYHVEIKKPEVVLKKEVPVIVEAKPVVPDTGLSGVRFRVQLAASTVKMDKTKLSSLTGLKLQVMEDFIDGYFKYTIGSEKTIEGAQSILNKLAVSNFKKPFIVAYSSGKRVSVEQAMAEIKAGQ